MKKIKLAFLFFFLFLFLGNPMHSMQSQKTVKVTLDNYSKQLLPSGITSGNFLVQRGGIVIPIEGKTGLVGRFDSYMKIAGEYISDFLVSPVYADIVHSDDVIITGSECVGFDCVSGMSFGYDTIVIKENSLRIFADDTSTVSGYPANDWRLIFNDSTSGGRSLFSVEDATATRRIFTLEAGAPVNSLYVEDSGRVGLGTAVPYTELHIVDGDTPTVRLDQDGTSGFAPQAWDVAGNETNFFIRDVTGGSLLSFRIQPDTPSNTLTLKNTGYVGIGTWSPESNLHVQGTDGTTKVLVEETSTTVASRTLLRLKNAGKTKLSLNNTDADNTWSVGNGGTYILFTLEGTGVNEMTVDNSGNLEVTGTSTAVNHINTSSREVKHGFQEVAQEKILQQLTQLPISSWQYNEGDNGNRHIGPVAEDFQEIFGLGDGKHISTVDTDGIALAAIQGLKIEKDHELAQLYDTNNQEMTKLRVEYEQKLANLRDELVTLRDINNQKLGERDQQIQVLQAELIKLRDLVKTVITPNTVAIRE